MTSQHDLHDFLALNPDFGQDRRDPETGVREWEELRSLGRRVFFDRLDENEEHPDHSRLDLTRRAERAAELAGDREARLEERFARLNPEFGVLPSRTDPQQHRFAQGRERALALGTRVYLAEARENPGSRELADWEVRQRALRASHRARDQRPATERAVETSRQGVER